MSTQQRMIELNQEQNPAGKIPQPVSSMSGTRDLCQNYLDPQSLGSPASPALLPIATGPINWTGLSSCMQVC